MIAWTVIALSLAGPENGDESSMTSHLVKVFDVLDFSFKDWFFAAHGLIPIIIALVLLFVPKITERQKLFLYVFLCNCSPLAPR